LNEEQQQVLKDILQKQPETPSNAQDLVRSKKASAHDVIQLRPKLARIQTTLQGAIDTANTLLAYAMQDSQTKEKVKNDVVLNLDSFKDYVTSTSELSQNLSKKVKALNNLAKDRAQELQTAAPSTDSPTSEIGVMDFLKKVHLSNLRLHNAIGKTEAILADFENNPASRTYTELALASSHQHIKTYAAQITPLCKELERKMEELMDFAPVYAMGKALTKASDLIETVMEDLEASLKKFEDNQDDYTAIKILVKQAALMRKQQPTNFDDESAVRIYTIAANTLSKQLHGEFEVIRTNYLDRKKAAATKQREAAEAAETERQRLATEAAAAQKLAEEPVEQEQDPVAVTETVIVDTASESIPE